MKIFIALIFATLSNFSLAVNIGFNQAWFHNDYAQQYLDHKFDEIEVDRIFSLANKAGASTVRLWLFESADFPMLIWNENQLLGLKPEFIKNFVRTLQMAQRNHIRIYMTIFDAHAYAPGKKIKKIRNFFNQQGTEQFLKLVMTPLIREIKNNNLLTIIEKIDVINEGDTVVNRAGFNQGWLGVKRMLCQWKQHLPEIATTMSVRVHPLLPLPLNLFSKNGPFACADFYDFHSYSDKGKIHACKAFKRYSDKKLKPIVLGEFGQSYFNHRYSNELQHQNTLNYIAQIKECGFNQALAWRLSDIREGHNKEARYSFEAFGTTRPAFDLIRAHNKLPH